MIQSEYANTISFPLADISLSKFLYHSLSKQDIIKLYGDKNIRSASQPKYFSIKKATIICSSLSIAILDEELKIIKECSHNSPEALYIWFSKNRDAIQPIALENALFASVLQQFNLGHWFIDSLPRIDIACRYLPLEINKTSLLIDTIDHSLIKKSLSQYKFKQILPTLNSSITHISR